MEHINLFDKSMNYFPNDVHKHEPNPKKFGFSDKKIEIEIL